MLAEPSVARMIADRRRVPMTRRRGVASVLSMMFLVVFSSLTAAMAVVAIGNLRTADSGLKVSRAMSAAETGLAFATRRLEQESARFVIEKGIIDADYAEDLWLGTYDQGSDGNVDILPPAGYPQGYQDISEGDGIVDAVKAIHAADSHAIEVEPGDASLPLIDQYGTLRVKPIAITDEAGGAYFRLRYELVAGEPWIRVTSTGVDADVSRTLQMDFRVDKKIEFAVLSPNRIMIGKNVLVEGPLGSRYGLVAGELDPEHGDPLVLRSDFYYLDENLDTTLDLFFSQIVTYDVDGDGRLRVDHPTESQGVTGNPELVDYDGNEYVDDFDLFLAHFDSNSDGRVVYDSGLAQEAGLGALSEEFVDVDDQMARLIDNALPDRDGDGEQTASDRSLGYRDGVVDVNDVYAKVRGRLAFAVARSAWETGHGESYQTVVNGPVVPGLDEAPVTFETPDEQMIEITTDMLDSSQDWFDTTSQGGLDFATQVANDPNGTYTAPNDDTWESVPFGATGAYDWYQRAVYDGYTFTNVRIPMGTNARFVDCTFVGVTFVETEDDNSHENWNGAGALEPAQIPQTVPPTFKIRFENFEAERVNKDPGVPIPDTRVWSNNIRFDGCTFLGSVSGTRTDEYTHWRNKLQFTGTTRFYIDPDDEDLLQQPDKDTLIALLNSITTEDREELEKSSIMMPGWSLDVGNFTNEQGANPEDTEVVKLKGVIVAGVLDVRGTADVLGTLLMTFRPTEGAGPLFYGGTPDSFNTTIGYFGPLDGDSEGVDPGEAEFEGFGEIRLRYNPDAKLPDGIPWPIRMDPVPASYWEGGAG